MWEEEKYALIELTSHEQYISLLDQLRVQTAYIMTVHVEGCQPTS